MNKVLVVILISSVFLYGCFDRKVILDCPADDYQNVVTIRFRVTDKGSGLPIKEAAVAMNIVHETWASLWNDCQKKVFIQEVFEGITNENGYCEKTFNAVYGRVPDQYNLSYSISKQLFENVKGNIIIKRDAERTIEIRLLNNTAQP